MSLYTLGVDVLYSYGYVGIEACGPGGSVRFKYPSGAYVNTSQSATSACTRAHHGWELFNTECGQHRVEIIQNGVVQAYKTFIIDTKQWGKGGTCGTIETHLGCSGNTCQQLNGSGNNTDGCISVGQTCSTPGFKCGTGTGLLDGCTWNIPNPILIIGGLGLLYFITKK